MLVTASNSESDEPYRQTCEGALSAAAADPSFGLSEAEAKRRLTEYGPNELDAPPPRPEWLKLLAQFTDTLVLLLLAAATISAAVWWYEGEAELPYEALAIFAIVILNGLLGYIQEARAERAAAALRQLSAMRSDVIRDGARTSIASADLVPGDIILIAEGDTIPADARLIQSAALQTMEAALTGESLPVSKDIAAIPDRAEIGDQRNMLFSGTIAIYGHGRAVVTPESAMMPTIEVAEKSAPTSQWPGKMPMTPRGTDDIAIIGTRKER